MSLDVYLNLDDQAAGGVGSGIFVREDGEIKEISRAEWDSKFPGREPVVAIRQDDDGPVYWANITHNLGKMAVEAGIYHHLWRPDELGITKAAELVEPLHEGLARLEAEPEHFKQFNPANGWGNYENLVNFTRNYLRACQEYPAAIVAVSR